MSTPTVSQAAKDQPQYTPAAPMQQTPPAAAATESPVKAPDRAPLGLRGGIEYDHPGTGLIHDICACFICCECMDDCCTIFDDTCCC
ncbi:hypothetical protein TI39_contig406g00016 [Zymoseptoria brevis]|uniref:Cysteine-rich transmembrane CYSTM domain-containing protein n=1 Tax=Zymoseptoria brevis TaxID=1047168 RepID=A0A0F4GQS7_9PEZI|nr:hypothetical protein TI39_contig406g00016 [Zymoseptoria brevis]